MHSFFPQYNGEEKSVHVYTLYPLGMSIAQRVGITFHSKTFPFSVGKEKSIGILFFFHLVTMGGIL